LLTKAKPIIYALLDPNTNEVRYIGKTVSLSKRLRKHISESKNDTKSHKKAWINSLIVKDQEPIMKILEKLEDSDSWKLRERYWIKYYKDIGAKLTNMTEGGDGTSGMIPWNYKLKGVVKPNSGSIIKGERR